MTDIPKLPFERSVIGLPRPQPRPRAFVRKGKDGTFRAATYEAGTAEAWKSDIASAFKDLAGARISHPIDLRIRFYMPRPKSHFKKDGSFSSEAFCAHLKTPDLDNLEKAVMDALTHIGVWVDDSYVVEKHTYKDWQKHGEPAGAYITIQYA